MASISRKPNSPYWMDKFRDDQGVIRMRSTKQRERREAMRVVMTWEDAAVKARQGELTQVAVLKTLSEMSERTTGEAVQVQSVSAFFEEWLESKETLGKSPTTVARYRPVLRGFLEFIGPHRSRVGIKAIVPTEIERFRDHQVKLGKSPTTANHALRVLRAGFNAARRRGLALSNPAEAVDLLAADAEEKKPFSQGQVKALLKVADIEWRGMILLGYHTGIRLHDAANLTWENLDLEENVLRFEAEKTSRRAKRRDRETIIYVHLDLIKYFSELPAGDEPSQPLFPTLSGLPSGSHGGLSNRFGRLMQKARIDAELGDKKSGQGRQFKALSFHSLRHTFISNLANAGVSQDVRKEISGHSSDEIHRRYTHLDLSTQREAIDQLGSLL